eukprot:4972367-Pyramimonas_sp.AAC.1
MAVDRPCDGAHTSIGAREPGRRRSRGAELGVSGPKTLENRTPLTARPPHRARSNPIDRRRNVTGHHHGLLKGLS